MVYKRPEAAQICPNKQFRHKIRLFFLPICQEEINKVFFVWVYELENKLQLCSVFIPNAGKYRPEKAPYLTPYLDTFHAVETNWDLTTNRASKSA